MGTTPNPVVFLDRDGTIIVDRHYLSSPSGVTLLPGAVDGLQRFRQLGFGLVLVTNQSGVGRGYFTMSAVEAVHAHLLRLLGREGVHLDGIFVCPHRPEDDCDCRKPRPGLIDRARAALDIDMSRSVVVGDKASDVRLGTACGIPSILVLSGQGSVDDAPEAVAAVPDLVAAAEWVASREREQGRM